MTREEMLKIEEGRRKMSTKEAVELIDNRMCFGRGKWSKYHMPVKDTFWIAGEMAIKALRTESCEDAVSRKYLLDEYDRQHKGAPGGARKIIENAPSVMPKPRTGKWMGSVCTACGESCSYSYDAEYCPNCGAKMEG